MSWRSPLTIVAVPILLALGAPNAAAQGPFAIDGVITDANNSGVAPGATKVTDANGNTQELGAKNASTTKIGVIHTAPLPMLNTTNPNANVDLNTIYTQSAILSSDLWFYFGWARDSANGSGFISIELQKSAPPISCNYATATPAALIAGCNPWQGRQDGDFIILWDQQGGSTAISYRIFDGLLGQFGPPNPIPPSIGLAKYGNADTSRGEAAVNISAIVAGQSESCLSFANIIPGTVTGNSDTADYKDTVLSLFPAASNCGTVVINKVTQDSAGVPFTTAASAGPFPFTLTAATTPIFNGTVDTDCTVSGQSDKNTCQASLAQGGSTATISDLLARSNYTLSEGTIDAKWEKFSIVCGTANVLPGGQAFSVPAGGSVTCTIINRLKQGTLKLVKTVTNDNGGSLGVADFPLFMNATSVISDQTVSFNSGTVVTASETNQLGYTAGTWGGDCTTAGVVTIVANVNKVCTITNNDQAPTLLLVKQVDNSAGGAATAASFTLTASGTTGFSGVGPSVSNPTSPAFQAGTYTLSESSVAGYSVKTNWMCSGPDGGAQNGGSVIVGVGESWTCTIVNMDSKASPTAATVQRATLHDTMNLTGIRPGASNAASATVTFKLFSNAGCTTQVGTTEVITNVTSGSATTVNGVSVTGTGPATYYWTAEYSGDNFNNPVTKGCGVETTAVNFQNNNVVP